MALTDSTRSAFRLGDGSALREEAAPPVYFLLHMSRTGGSTIAAHLKTHPGDRICPAPRPAPLQMLGRTRYRFDEAPDFGRVRAATGHYLGGGRRVLAGADRRRRTGMRLDGNAAGE